jgi:glucan phosphoethanolaminetransferase (alkaline phosphatase superfamily)
MKDATKVNDYDTGLIVGMLTTLATLTPLVLTALLLEKLPVFTREVALIVMAFTVIFGFLKFFRWVERRVYRFIVEREIASVTESQETEKEKLTLMFIGILISVGYLLCNLGVAAFYAPETFEGHRIVVAFFFCLLVFVALLIVAPMTMWLAFNTQQKETEQP